MIIEFIGIPGSGKTYIAEKLKVYLAKEFPGISIYNRKDLFRIRKKLINNKIKQIIYVLPFLFDLRILRLIGHLLMLNESLRIKKVVIQYFLSILFEHNIIGRITKDQKTKALFILDEGMLHVSELFMDCDYKGTKMRLLQSLKSLSKKWHDLERFYVFIDGDSSVSYERINSREQGWPYIIRNKGAQEKMTYLEKFNLKFEDLKQSIKEENQSINIKSTAGENEILQYFSEIKAKIRG